MVAGQAGCHFKNPFCDMWSADEQFQPGFCIWTGIKQPELSIL